MIFPAFSDTAQWMLLAGMVMVAIIALLAGYRKWQSESAHVVLSSDEYKAREDALCKKLTEIVTAEGQRTRDLLSVKVDALGISLDRVERNAATRADFMDLRGKVSALQQLNQVFHGVRASDSGSVLRESA